MGARTDAARAEVLARRGEFAGEAERLEASARAAVDIPGKIRRHPLRTVGAAGGAAFMVLGGPQRLFKRARRAIQGPQADRPKSLLPREVDRILSRMGDDGEKVRAQVEREFARWLRERAKAGTGNDAKAAALAMVSLALKPAVTQIGKSLARQVANPDPEGFAKALQRIQRRNSARATSESSPVEPAPARGPEVTRR